MDTYPLEIEFSSRLEYLDLVYHVVNELTETLKLESREKMQLSVAVSEAVTNAMVHGNRNDSTKKVRLEIVMEPSFLQIDVVDEGDGSFHYDPSKHGIMDESHFELERGRGIFIMRHYLDKLAYSQTLSRGTRVSLFKSLSRQR